jgi:hypothetical protein
MDGDPTDVGAAQSDFTGVNSRPHFDSQRPQYTADCLSAGAQPARAIEGGEHAITCCVVLRPR